jgi:hypothetical protein
VRAANAIKMKTMKEYREWSNMSVTDMVLRKVLPCLHSNPPSTSSLAQTKDQCPSLSLDPIYNFHISFHSLKSSSSPYCPFYSPSISHTNLHIVPKISQHDLFILNTHSSLMFILAESFIWKSLLLDIHTAWSLSFISYLLKYYLIIDTFSYFYLKNAYLNSLIPFSFIFPPSIFHLILYIIHNLCCIFHI